MRYSERGTPLDDYLSILFESVTYIDFCVERGWGAMLLWLPSPLNDPLTNEPAILSKGGSGGRGMAHWALPYVRH